MNTPQVSKYLIKGEMQGEKVMNNLREFLHRLTGKYMKSKRFWSINFSSYKNDETGYRP